MSRILASVTVTAGDAIRLHVPDLFHKDAVVKMHKPGRVTSAPGFDVALDELAMFRQATEMLSDICQVRLVTTERIETKPSGIPEPKPLPPGWRPQD